MSTTWVLAFAVMNNHVHLIVRQGRDPLGWMMQRIFQRTALLVQRTFGVKERIFGTRYWSGVCDEPRYLRQVIAYTHLNPCYARLCDHPDDYRWTSHSTYKTYRDGEFGRGIRFEHGLRLFEDGVSSTRGLCDDYCEFIEFWRLRERLPLGAKFIFTESDAIQFPRADAGDEFWHTEYGGVVIPPASKPLADIQDFAINALRRINPELTLQQVRTSGRIRTISSVRRELIGALVTHDYQNGAIARCLNVTTGFVSQIASQVRNPHRANISAWVSRKD